MSIDWPNIIEFQVRSSNLNSFLSLTVAWIVVSSAFPSTVAEILISYVPVSSFLYADESTLTSDSATFSSRPLSYTATTSSPSALKSVPLTYVVVVGYTSTLSECTVGLTTSSVYSAFAPLYSTTYVYSPATFVSSLAVLAFT